MSARGGKELPFGEKCAIMAADSQASEVSHEKETIVPRLRARADALSAPRRTGAGAVSYTHLAWTGALIAALLDLRLKLAVPAITAGVFLAGIIISLLTYGAAALL